MACGISGSPGRIRTYDTLINSQLRYHCATGECGVRFAQEKSIQMPEKDASENLRFLEEAGGAWAHPRRAPPLSAVSMTLGAL